jgi:GNAT superfamily N-acetyltransferase
MDGVLVREFRVGDSVEALTDLLHRAYRELAEAGMRFTATHQSVATTQRRIDEGECLVAEWNGQIVGTIVWVRPSAEDSVEYYRHPHVAHFGQFGVCPHHRGLGIGQALLQRVEQEAAHAGYTELALDTSENATHLIALYEKWGYAQVATHDWRPGVNYLSVVMAKSLAPTRIE